MAHNHAVYRSNEVSADTEGIEQLLDETHQETEEESRYNVDGNVHIDENTGTVWLGSTTTTFEVWNYGYSETLTEEFLERVADHIEETLVIRSVGHTGLRHIPNAWQWVVTPDGDVEKQWLDHPNDI